MRIHVRRGPSVLDVASLGVNNTDAVLLRYSNLRNQFWGISFDEINLEMILPSTELNIIYESKS